MLKTVSHIKMSQRNCFNFTSIEYHTFFVGNKITTFVFYNLQLKCQRPLNITAWPIKELTLTWQEFIIVVIMNTTI